MTITKTKMSASYRAIFIFSIFMFFFVLFAGAATNSKSTGFGMWLWGYTVWLMYKRRVSDLVSFYKGLMWFEVIAAGIALSVLTSSDGDVSKYVGYTTVEAALMFALVISLSYGLYRYFLNLQNNPLSNSVSSYEIRAMDLANENFYAEALDEIKNQKQRPGLWAIALAKNKGDINLATANYISQRVSELTQKPNSDIHFKSTEKSSNLKKYVIFMVIGAFSIWLYFITIMSGSDNELGNFFRQLFNITKK